MEAFKAMMGAMTPGPWVVDTPYDDGDFSKATIGHGEPRGAQFAEESLGELWDLNLGRHEFEANAAGIVASVTLAQFLASDAAREAIVTLVAHARVHLWTADETADALLRILAEKATAR